MRASIFTGFFVILVKAEQGSGQSTRVSKKKSQAKGKRGNPQNPTCLKMFRQLFFIQPPAKLFFKGPGLTGEGRRGLRGYQDLGNPAGPAVWQVWRFGLHSILFWRGTHFFQPHTFFSTPFYLWFMGPKDRLGIKKGGPPSVSSSFVWRF